MPSAETDVTSLLLCQHLARIRGPHAFNMRSQDCKLEGDREKFLPGNHIVISIRDSFHCGDETAVRRYIGENGALSFALQYLPPGNRQHLFMSQSSRGNE